MFNIYRLLTKIYGQFYNRPFIPSFLFSPLRYLIRKLANILIPYYFKKKRVEPTQSKTLSKRVVVTLTSFPKRIDNVWLVIECLLRQTVKADCIVLWLSKEQFPREYANIPTNLKILQSEIFKIRFVEGDIRSHKKYYYAFKEFPHDFVITVDDDIFYPPYMIEELLKAKEQCCDAIIGRYCLVMKFDLTGSVRPYKSWSDNYEIGTKNAFLGTGGGTLFEPCKLNSDALNIDLALRLAPLADDVWLNAIIRLSKLSINIISKELLMPIITKGDQRLTQVNVYENRNDEQIEAVINNYQTTIGINPFVNEQ